MISRKNCFNMKILNYDEFSSLNESFQSSKLKNIIAQHGKPKYEMDNVFLHDLKDEEVVGVFTWDEWYDYHKKNKKSFCIHLADDKYLAISNPDILTGWLDDNENKKDFEKEILKRRDERHVGNELNGLNHWEKIDAMKDKTNDRFKKKKNELIHSRALKLVKDILAGHEKEFVDALRKFFEDSMDDVELDTGKCYAEDDEFKFLNKQWYVNIEYSAPSGENSVSRYGASYCNFVTSPEKCEIGYADDEYDEIFDIKEIIEDKELLKKFFSEYDAGEVECGITDPYEYYGVSRSDFY